MSTYDPEHMKKLRENSRKPVRITENGRIYLGEEEFLFPVTWGSIKVERHGTGRHLLTMTILVGDVDMKLKPQSQPETGDD